MADVQELRGDHGAARYGPTGTSGHRSVLGARSAIVALLVVLVAVGLHAQVPAPVFRTASRSRDIAVAGPLDGVGTVLLVALGLWSHRHPTDQLLVARLRRALWWVLGTAVAALSLVLAALIVNISLPATTGGQAPKTLSPSRPRKPPTAATAHAGSLGLPLREVLYGLLAAALLAALVAIAWRLARSGRPQKGPEPEPPAEEYQGALQDAIAGGQRALLRLDDARAAIIACYVAMEESLRRAGTARASTDTPDELLAKAAGTLQHTAAAARRLTALFYEARFSTHHMDQRSRDDAEGALAELAAELRSSTALMAGAAG